jgi:replicative DNA helicase
MAIYSLQVEKHALSGLIRHPEAYADIESFLTENDFVNEVHHTIFSVFRDTFNKGEQIDKVLISQKCQNLGITFKDQNIDIFNYVNSICLIPTTRSGVIESAKELLKLRIRREIEETGEEIKKFANSCADKPIEEIITQSDVIYNKNISVYTTENNKPEDITKNTIEIIEERGNNPVQDTGLVTPYPNFNRLYGGIRAGNLYAWVSRPKHGKAVALDTPILTSFGWKQAKDIQIGDMVYSSDGSPTKVLATQVWHDADMYKVSTDDGFDVVVAGEHEWSVNLHHNNPAKWQILETKDLVRSSADRRPRLPINDALSSADRDFSIHPYVLGYWLGDGNSDRGQITCSIEDADWVLEKFISFGYPDAIKKQYPSQLLNNSVFCIVSKKLGKQLSLANLINNKHVPKEYLLGGQSQRKSLLQGLMDSDGHVSPNSGRTYGQSEFCSTNINLAESVQYLVNSLGSKASLNTNKSALYGKVCKPRHRVTFYYDESCLMPRKADRLRKDIYKNRKGRYITVENLNRKDSCICFQVEHPSHLFLCGRGLIPTHNSTILNDLAIKVTSLNPGCKALVLDTEMSTMDMKFRIASSLTQIPVWYLETGNWKKNANLFKLFQEKKSEILKIQNQVKHIQVSGKPVAEIASIVKRWYFAEVGRGNNAVVVYDYIKLTGESDKNKQEYQLIGDKVNALKELCSELNIAILTACQLNRSAENGIDDSSAIAQSDRLQWFASFVGIFRRKTVEEIADDGEDFGSHKLIPLATRFQGKDSAGHHDLVRIQEGKKVRYQNNFISFNIDNFNVEERGTLSEIVQSRSLRPELNDSEDGEIL